MLVLTRREGQRVMVATPCGTMVISTFGIEHGRLRIAFDAPPDFKIIREEAALANQPKGERVNEGEHKEDGTAGRVMGPAAGGSCPSGSDCNGNPTTAGTSRAVGEA